MISLLHDSIIDQARHRPDSVALRYKDQQLSYQELANQISDCAHNLIKAGLNKNDRVAIYLPKQLENVISMYAASMAGGVFVPLNPGLKPRQVEHILKDSGARFLVSAKDRIQRLGEVIPECPALEHVISVDTLANPEAGGNVSMHEWEHFIQPSNDNAVTLPERIDADLTAILYTSGSTGRPKGVVLSHRNMVTGAKSVSSYLKNTAQDVVLAVLPFSFDAGLSQLTTAFQVGACVVSMDYLLPRDVIKAVERYQATGLAAVPPLWNQLATLEWPEQTAKTLRYITNTGGAMPRATLDRLRKALPETEVFLMYGLTEAFRSTYLDPSQLDARPGSMGKAIPNAQILVVREDGSECDPEEPGELVHRGALVAQGYWNDPVKTAERFKPAPGQLKELPNPELAVWSGDQVKKDSEGYLYFITRKDEMIKTSGYRVSPTEIEEELFASGMVVEAVVFGVAHPMLGQAIVAVIQINEGFDEKQILKYCQQNLANYMVPQKLVNYDQLPRNPNGKIDRNLLKNEFKDMFSE